MTVTMATKSVTPRLALVGILFASLLIFHECSYVRGEEGSKEKGRMLKGFISQKKCMKAGHCKSAKCWCCVADNKACWKDLQSCIRHCNHSSHSHTLPNYLHD
ncbi:hypothetical protein ABFX02_11G107300 [Erythranthe guttata]